MIIGALPLLSFFVNLLVPDTIASPYLTSSALTAAAFLAIGAVKARFVDQVWYWSALETLFIGGCAAALAYAVGVLCQGMA